tara:strand:+ start:644 stop:1057 length:414 start_codon:yes stop_codon:yes gene_type:complete
MDYDEIRAKLKTRLETVSTPESFVAVFDNVPDSIVVPCAIVVPASTAITYHEAMGTVAAASTTCFFNIIVAAQRFESASAQNLLNDYLVSVPTALEADQTLDGQATALTVTAARNYGRLPFADSVFLAVELDLEVLV